MDLTIDWAIEMLRLGYETPSLLILAGISKPTNYSETYHYLKATLKEMHLEEKTGIPAIASCCTYYIRKIASNTEVEKNLHSLINNYYHDEFDAFISDFYLLYWALDELYYTGDQHYWPGAHAGNIASLIVQTAEQWLIENKVSLL